MILFRADGNPSIGLGHIMRNLSIADAFREMGEYCCFVLADDRLTDLIQSRGFACKVLGSAYDHMDSEVDQFCDIICDVKPKTVFLDSYFVTENYFDTLHEFCMSNEVKLVYVDDILSFPYACDVLLNYNIYASEGKYRKLYKGFDLPQFILGTAYAPLRKEFQDLPERTVKEQGRVILVSTGGADSEHLGVELAKKIADHNKWRDYVFHFIVGSMNGDKDQLESIVKRTSNIVLHENVRAMATLMQSCDMAVSAAGSTMYELCATQTPTITYVLADNQIPGADGFERNGIIYNAGDIRVTGAKKLAEKILDQAVELANDYQERCDISNRMKSVVDGKGAMRIAESIRRK